MSAIPSQLRLAFTQASIPSTRWNQVYFWIRHLEASYPERRRKDFTRYDLEKWLRSLRQNPDLQIWQQEQAALTMEIFARVYIDRPDSEGEAPTPPHANTPATPRSAEGENHDGDILEKNPPENSHSGADKPIASYPPTPTEFLAQPILHNLPLRGRPPFYLLPPPNPLVASVPPGFEPDSEALEDEAIWEDIHFRLQEHATSLGYAPRTFLLYWGWIRRFLKFHSLVEPLQLGFAHRHHFLAHLEVQGSCSSVTFNQARNALAFYFSTLTEDPAGKKAFSSPPARVAVHLPETLTAKEADQVLFYLEGNWHAMGLLAYSAGMRLMEILSLRVGDLDFESNQILVRNAQGTPDRWVPLPVQARSTIIRQLAWRKQVFANDRLRNWHHAEILPAFGPQPSAASTFWEWQLLFIAVEFHRDDATGLDRRYALNPASFQRAVLRAARNAGIPRRITVQTLRNSHALRLAEAGISAEAIQHRLGHRDTQRAELYRTMARRPR